MGEASADGGTMGEIDHLPSHRSGRPRDLLRQLSSEIHHHHQSRTEESEDIELSLGLSLGGVFGVDPFEKNRLVRSSSIAGFARIPSYDDLGTSGIPPVSPAITRTVSLPTDTEEDRRKRKEMQCLRRMEAKRKRTEKQKNLSYRSVGKDEDKRGEEEGIIGIPIKGKALPGTANGFSTSVGSAYAMAAGWGSGSARVTAAVDPMNGKSGVLTASVGLMGFVPSSQGSAGSQGSSSSGLSDFESRVNQGLNTNEARSPTSVQSLPEHADKKLAGSRTEKLGKPTGEEVVHKMNNCILGLKKPKVEENGVVREMGKNVMEEMPCVTTRGCGPNGRRIEGFLYRYRKGEEVRIVCVCHGNFLSPAEFVKHAGGGDVQYPLKHIVVNPSSSFL
ncbi:ninja-family protein AFP3-like [Aristolochia californica]|uniref:ninja-family protein AFP3-like n=1 Tax=Aristolochia californica TaxID=171875 RepID=UPI0035DF2220